MKQKHNIGPSRAMNYICNLCNQTFTTRHALKRHQKRLHRSSISFNSCDSQFVNETEVKQNQKVHRVTADNETARSCEEDDYRLVESTRKNYLKVLSFTPKALILDPVTFLDQYFERISSLVQTDLETQSSIKFQLSLCVKLFKPTKEIEIDTCFISKMQTLYSDGLTPAIYTDLKHQILKKFENFCQHGSGWTVKKILNLGLNFAKHTPIKVGTFIPTPRKFANNHFLLNIKTLKSNNCFELCIKAAQHYLTISKHRNRPGVYKTLSGPDMSQVETPVKLKDIEKIEDENKLSINVFAIDKDVYPLRISHKDYYPIDLLLLEEDGKFHYCLITNFQAFMRRQTKKKNQFYCRKCLCGSYGQDSFENHKMICAEKPCRIKMKSNTQMFWKNFSATMRVPFIIYADMEAITPKVNEPQNKASTRKIEKQIPCGIFAICLNGEGKVCKTFFSRNENCINQFLDTMRLWAKDIYKSKRKFPIYRKNYGDEKLLEQATHCSICGEVLESDRVIDHNHLNGEFRGIAHKNCNSSCRTTNFTPIVFHNGSKYDFKQILRYYQRGEEDEKLDCIANNSEEFISFSISIPTGTFQNKNNERKTTFERLRFIDSYRFQAKSLSSLIETMKADSLPFPSFNHIFAYLTKEQENLILQKGVYPYSYVDSFTKFSETKLPDIWINTLTNERISESDYQHAKDVWHALQIHNLGEYHDIYLRVDVTTLADVFENFRKLCFHHFNLDPAHFLTAPHFAWNAMLKTTKVKLDILAEKDHLDIVRRGIRGGMCGVYHSRYFQANNPRCENYEDTKPTTWLILLDANNLYGGVMCENLPSGNFSDVKISIEDVLATSDSSPHGYFVVLDLEYPSELHDQHNDYPLAPDHMEITKEMLSMWQSETSCDSGRTMKLLQTFHGKQFYVCHYRILKFYVRHGLVISKVHRIIKFEQSPWMKTYIDINTSIRRTAKTDCLKDLGKLLNNSVFGKSMEDLMNRQNIKLFTDEDQCQKYISKPNFKSFKIFHPDLCAVLMSKTIVTWNKPTYIGASVLDLSKLVMYRFLYETIKPKYGDQAKLLYSDTDSLLLAIETEDLYKDFESMQEVFDFSDYPKDHPLYSDSNKRKVLKMKDEMNGVVIDEYVGLKAKMYSISASNKIKKCAKGVTKTIQKTLHHELYKEVLRENLTVKEKMRTLRSHNLELFVEECDKIVLSSVDNKRYMTEGHETLAFGHYKASSTNFISKSTITKEDPSLLLNARDFIVTKHSCERLGHEQDEGDADSELFSDDDVDPGFISSEESESELVYIPPKRTRPNNPLIIYEALEKS